MFILGKQFNPYLIKAGVREYAGLTVIPAQHIGYNNI